MITPVNVIRTDKAAVSRGDVFALYYPEGASQVGEEMVENEKIAGRILKAILTRDGEIGIAMPPQWELKNLSRPAVINQMEEWIE